MEKKYFTFASKILSTDIIISRKNFLETRSNERFKVEGDFLERKNTGNKKKELIKNKL